ncbi:hypothetical protein NOC27_2076 [Nitrosococcus oceani AFC27]|nr:hypothetical protein NOC27_2076 [Nitrosococcus oceani AFC27]
MRNSKFFVPIYPLLFRNLVLEHLQLFHIQFLRAKPKFRTKFFDELRDNLFNLVFVSLV